MAGVTVLQRAVFLPQSEKHGLESFAQPDASHTVYTRRSRSRRPRHLSREAGALDGLGSLFDLVLVAASVCSNYLTGSRFHMNCKHKTHMRWLGGMWTAPPQQSLDWRRLFFCHGYIVCEYLRHQNRPRYSVNEPHVHGNKGTCHMVHQCGRGWL